MEIQAEVITLETLQLVTMALYLRAHLIPMKFSAESIINV